MVEGEAHVRLTCSFNRILNRKNKKNKKFVVTVKVKTEIWRVKSKQFEESNVKICIDWRVPVPITLYIMDRWLADKSNIS